MTIQELWNRNRTTEKTPEEHIVPEIISEISRIKVNLIASYLLSRGEGEARGINGTQIRRSSEEDNASESRNVTA